MPEQEMVLNLAVLGPPVSGKGTQAKLLAEALRLPHISTGQILQTIKADAGQPLSAEVAGYMNAGQLVPTALVNQLVTERIKEPDCLPGYILDGFPRTLEQAKFLDQLSKLSYVFSLTVRDEVLIERMSGRRVCPQGHSWHLKYSPPQDPAVCDTCGQPLSQRDDDKPETVQSRLEIFHRETDPIVDFYRQQKVLLEIDGEKSIPEVQKQMIDSLNSALKKSAEA